MVDKLTLDIAGTEYGPDGEDAIREYAVMPAGVGVLGTADITLKDDGGAFTIVPMQRVKTGRKTGAGALSPRLLQGVIARLTQTQELGTTTKQWGLNLQDVNVVGTKIGTPLTFTYAAVTGHNYGYHISHIVDAVQIAYGAVSEAIDATSQVPSDIGIGNFDMPALEGGHELNWYLDQINAKVVELSSAAIIPAYFYGMDTAGGGVFGGVFLYAYDSVNLPTPGTFYSTSPTGVEKAIRAWKVDDDATTLYVRRQASYATGSVTGYDSTANSTFACPFSAGGWWAKPDDYGNVTAAQAQARIDADVAQNAYPLRTVTLITDRAIHQPGDVIGVTIDLTPLAAEPFRVVRSRVIFEDKIADYALTEITAGLLPRGLGRRRTTGAIPSFVDTVPPEAPADAPTVVTNKFIGSGGDGPGVARVEVRTVHSISHDIGAHRLRYKINSGRAVYSDWIAATGGPGPGVYTTFPPKDVPAGASIRVDVQARDTHYNEQPDYGPYYDFTASVGVNERPVGFEGEDTWDQDPGTAGINGWQRAAISGACTAARETTEVYFGKVSLALTVPTTAFAAIEYAGPRVAAQASKQWEVLIARKATAATGTAQLLIRYYNSADSLISTLTAWSGTPTTGWVEQPAANRIADVPSGTAYFVPVLRLATTGTAVTCYFSIDVTHWRALVGPTGLEDAAVETSKIANLAVTDGKIDGTNGIFTATKLKPRTNDSTFVTWYDTAGPTAKGDVFYSNGGDAFVVTARANVKLNVKDGFGNQIIQNADGISLTGISDVYLAAGRLKLAPAVKSSTFTADALNTIYLCSGTITANLPTAASINGALYAFVNTGTGVITIDPNSSQTVGGHTTWLLYRDASILITSDGSNWQVVAQHSANEGTAFPTTGLYDGLKYYRRDLYETYVYNNGLSGWLSEGYVPVNMQKRQTQEFYAPSQDWEAFSGPQPPYGLYIEGVDIGGFIGGTNDSSNFWNFEFWGIAYPNSVTVLGEVDSDDIWTANVWSNGELTLSTSNPMAAGDYEDFELVLKPTGTPSDIIVVPNVRAKKFRT